MKTTLTAGVKGTDNCPVCGKTMERHTVSICGRLLFQLTCNADEDHHTQIMLDPDMYAQRTKRGG